MQLDPSQQSAAEHFEGPALILAGPGSGKTTTLVARYARMVERGIAPRAILTTTFTRAAADQLRTRVEARAGVRTRGLPIGTFHGLCMRMLREPDVAAAVDLVPDFGIISDAQQYGVLRELGLGDHFDLDVLKEAIGRFKETLVTPTEALARAKEERDPDTRAEMQEMALAYRCYQEALWKAQRLDFGDLIRLAVRALSRDDALREVIASRYAFLMVDEFQDINAAQYALIEAIAGEHRNLWVVGDDDQAIYGWRGSDVRFITSFERRFPGATRVVLDHNYRSQPVIVRAASALIARNPSRLEKSMAPVRETAVPIRVVSCGNEAHEGAWIAQTIETMTEHGVALEHIAVLTRTHHLMLPIQSALDAAGIPCVVRGGVNIWRLPEVRLLLDMAREMLRGRPIRGSMPWLRERCRDVLGERAHQPFHEQLAVVADAIADGAPGSASDERRMQWSEAVRMCAAGAAECDSLEDFLEGAREQERGAQRKGPSTGVTLSTMHQAKGLEWRAVFVAGCEEGRVPHEQADDPEEERRLFFVAVTRAKTFLSVTWARRRGKKDTRPSPYIEELTAGLGEAEIARREHPERSASEARGEEDDGEERVWHAKHGFGVVLKKHEDRWTVHFVCSGVRKIKSSFLEVIT